MAIVISGTTGIDMGNNPVSNASQIDGTVINENGSNVRTENDSYSKTEVDGKIVGFKNYIINGNFSVWQRGTSFTGLTNGTYSADRWVVYDSAGNINYNVIRNAGVFNTGYGATYSFNSGTGIRSVIQFIENVTRFKVGSNVTISFEAYTNSTPYTIAVAIQGAKGTWASATGVVTSNIALTNTKTKYSVTLPIPDWTSLGIDWANLENTKLALKFDLGVETNGRDFILGSVQLEEGSVATPFENRPYGLELGLCQRYYEVGRCIQQLGIGTTIGVVLTGQVFFKTSKRIFPTITYLDFSGAQNKVSLLNNSGTETNGVSVIAGNQTNNDMRLTASTTNTTQNGISFTYTASAEL